MHLRSLGPVLLIGLVLGGIGLMWRAHRDRELYLYVAGGRLIVERGTTADDAPPANALCRQRLVLNPGVVVGDRLVLAYDRTDPGEPGDPDDDTYERLVVEWLAPAFDTAVALTTPDVHLYHAAGSVSGARYCEGAYADSADGTITLHRRTPDRLEADLHLTLSSLHLGTNTRQAVTFDRTLVLHRTTARALDAALRTRR